MKRPNPPIAVDDRYGWVTVPMTPNLQIQIRIAAATLNISRAELMRQAIVKHLRDLGYEVESANERTEEPNGIE